MSKIIQNKARILSNIHLTGNYYKLAFSLPEVAGMSRPGQFVMLHISKNYQPLLRRPFSIHSASNHKHRGRVEIIYEVVGKGTKILSEKKPGEYLDILGPLGNGFEYRTPNTEHRIPIIVAGGMGVAPLFFLAQRLINRTPNTEHQTPIILIGANTKKSILCKKEFASLDLDVKISSDDGSVGFKGKATELLRSILRTIAQSRKRTNEQIIYACGPESMLSEVAVISKQYRIPAQISLDEYMACGLGVCLGCMIKTREGQRLVCKDGPVFDASEISWNNK